MSLTPTSSNSPVRSATPQPTGSAAQKPAEPQATPLMGATPRAPLGSERSSIGHHVWSGVDQLALKNYSTRNTQIGHGPAEYALTDAARASGVNLLVERLGLSPEAAGEAVGLLATIIPRTLRGKRDRDVEFQQALEAFVTELFASTPDANRRRAGQAGSNVSALRARLLGRLGGRSGDPPLVRLAAKRASNTERLLELFSNLPV